MKRLDNRKNKVGRSLWKWMVESNVEMKLLNDWRSFDFCLLIFWDWNI